MQFWLTLIKKIFLRLLLFQIALETHVITHTTTTTTTITNTNNNNNNNNNNNSNNDIGVYQMRTFQINAVINWI